MDSRKLKILLIAAAVLCWVVPAQAQTGLSLLTPVTGHVVPDSTNVWTFSAQNGAILSFSLTANTKDFDPEMALTDSSGREVVSSDDYNYPASLNPLLEAITMPRTDTFTLTVSGFHGTSGDYTLTMLPGYSVLAHSDTFSGSTWQAHSGALALNEGSGQLQASVQGARQNGVAFDSAGDNYTDFYAQAQVDEVTNSSASWSVGMAVRRQGDSYYLLSISHQGLWRFSLFNNGTEQVIRDWTPHPNIVPGANKFSIGVLANGVGFDFFYNSGYIGSASDTTLTAAGQIGLMAGTISSTGTQTNATFSNLIVTTPTIINGNEVIPQEILAGDGRSMVQSLKHYDVISADGQLSLTLDDSSAQYVGAGVNRLMLGRGARYTNFAIGANVDLAPATSGPAGCGIVFRLTDETDYTLAYLDQSGEYGVSTRSGDTFAPGLYGTNSALDAGTHHLLIIANDHTIYYYIDRLLVGTLDNAPQDGQVGIAVVNFEPNSTTCHYTNLWLWNWG